LLQLHTMFPLILLCFALLFRKRGSLILENLVVRQQLAVRKRRRPRPPLHTVDKLFWVVVRRFWPEWVESRRKDLLDHVILVNERHLKRLLSEYVSYYHEVFDFS